jgi:hypothetical protein
MPVWAQMCLMFLLGAALVASGNSDGGTRPRG